MKNVDTVLVGKQEGFGKLGRLRCRLAVNIEMAVKEMG
jgi:hypothetical protein